uniref:Uncharacterized protein n=1 Tax=Arundo donax TaxID=35708 RepID=A0A0A8ZTV6_ARUDO
MNLVKAIKLEHECGEWARECKEWSAWYPRPSQTPLYSAARSAQPSVHFNHRVALDSTYIKNVHVSRTKR